MIPKHRQMAAHIIKYGTVPSPEITKSDFTIGFSVVDLAGNKVWLMNFCSLMRFSEFKIEK